MKKEMLINVLQPEECRIAIVEDGILEELYVERTSLESYTGNIYKGKIVNLEPAIQAAFVDFSVGRNGFLHVSDVEPQYFDRHRDEPPPPRERDRERSEREPRRRFPKIDDTERDRPDRMEKGRRDRSTARRFGEGLLGEEELPPLPPPAPPPPPALPPVHEEPPARPSESSFIAEYAWAEPRPTPGVPFEPAPREEVAPESVSESAGLRERGPRAAEPIDPDLPPSRTQRGRGRQPAARAVDLDVPTPSAPPVRYEHEPTPEPPPRAQGEPEREPRFGAAGVGVGVLRDLRRSRNRFRRSSRKSSEIRSASLPRFLS